MNWRFTEQEKEAMVNRLLEGRLPPEGIESAPGGRGCGCCRCPDGGERGCGGPHPGGEVFASVLGGAPAQTELLDWMGVPGGASDTHNG